jgi:orotate phosphoribosyltransferase
MGTSTAGIAHAALAAHIQDLPAGYVEELRQNSRRTARIEGKTEAGAESGESGGPHFHRGSAVELPGL